MYNININISFFSYKNLAWLGFVALPLLFGCNSTKYKIGEKTFLTKNNIKVEGKVQNMSGFRDGLATLYKQRPVNWRKRWFYYNTKGRLQRRFGEIPTFYDETVIKQTIQSMEYYLQHKGYYNAEVKHDLRIVRNHAHITYIAKLNELFTIDKVKFVSKDSMIQKILTGLSSETYLKQGAPFDISLYRQEVARVTNAIRNSGYANFASNYISPLEADTSNFKTNITFTVLGVPTKTIKESRDEQGRIVRNTVDTFNRHLNYNIGQIRVQTNYKPATTSSRYHQIDSIFKGVTFSSSDGKFPHDLDLLNACIVARSNERFRQEYLDVTYRKLENLNAFRLINIKSDTSLYCKNEVDLLITLVPFGKRSVATNFELNTTQGGNSGFGGNVGISASVNLKNNNVFKGAERSSTNLEFGVQGLFADDNQFYESSLQQEFSLPKFSDPLRFWRGLNKISLYNRGSALNPRHIKILPDAVLDNMQNTAATKFRGGFKFIQSIPIDYLQINSNFGFQMPLNRSASLTINQLSLEYLRPINVNEPIRSNPFLRRLFGQQLVTSILLKDISYIAQLTPKNSNGWVKKVRFSVEQSGLELFAINKIVDISRKRVAPFKIGNSDYSRFVKSEIDISVGRPIGYNQSLHLRANVGAALPYGYQNTIVPYVKQFYVGGPTSMRGWQPRELGPGGWVATTPGNSQNYYATGDVKLEANAEVRFGLWWIFKSAFFLDVGNVWALNSNVNFPEGNFDKKFYNQLAVTVGTGLRIDFEYSVIRFDFGRRIRYPFPDAEGNYWNTNSGSERKKWNLTFGLGYPF